MTLSLTTAAALMVVFVAAWLAVMLAMLLVALP
jgi:hypothetical protein